MTLALASSASANSLSASSARDTLAPLREVTQPTDTIGDQCLVGGLSISATHLGEAWVSAVDALMRPGVEALEPLVITVTDFDAAGRPRETPAVVSLIDEELRVQYEARATRHGSRPKYGPLTVATAANTIFPESLWNATKDRQQLYDQYARLLPRLKRDPRNKRGIYFERLIAFGRGPERGNQVEHMLQAFAKGVKRTSAYQATIADPLTDQTKTPLLGFPCLQQIAVHPSEQKGTLAITGFYGTQYLVERGYGNLLGLCRLGRFLSWEMGLRLTRMTCVASYAPVESIGKTRGRQLVEAARTALAGRELSDQAIVTDPGEKAPQSSRF
jgi:hypothetical protein